MPRNGIAHIYKKSTIMKRRGLIDSDYLKNYIYPLHIKKRINESKKDLYFPTLKTPLRDLTFYSGKLTRIGTPSNLEYYKETLDDLMAKKDFLAAAEYCTKMHSTEVEFDSTTVKKLLIGCIEHLSTLDNVMKQNLLDKISLFMQFRLFHLALEIKRHYSEETCASFVSEMHFLMRLLTSLDKKKTFQNIHSILQTISKLIQSAKVEYLNNNHPNFRK